MTLSLVQTDLKSVKSFRNLVTGESFGFLDVIFKEKLA